MQPGAVVSDVLDDSAAGGRPGGHAWVSMSSPLGEEKNESAKAVGRSKTAASPPCRAPCEALSTGRPVDRWRERVRLVVYVTDVVVRVECPGRRSVSLPGASWLLMSMDGSVAGGSIGGCG
jgi:hypothetical protein